MSVSPVRITFAGNGRPAMRLLRVVREQIGRALTPGYRWRDPHTGRFVRKHPLP